MRRIKHVTVTGGAGYLGSVLVPILLERGFKVTVIDRFYFGRETLPIHADLVLIEDDIRSMDVGLLETTDAVVDLASISNDPAGELDPDTTLDTNWRARVRTAAAAKRAGASRYVFPSSCSVYGNADGLVAETSPVAPLTTYAEANVLAERDVLPLGDHDFACVVLRFATLYGASPRMRFDLAVNGMVRAMFIDGNIAVLRDGNQWRPLLHVNDAARVIVDCLSAPIHEVAGEIFNVGSEQQNVQILPLAKIVAEALGRDLELRWYGAPDTRSYRVDFAKARRVLRFQPAFDVTQGAREIYAGLLARRIDPHDPRAITVAWYQHLLKSSHARRR